jgi:hypothetical protein
VRFECQQRFLVPFLENLEQQLEVDVALADGQMSITAAVVVVDVNFPQMIGQGFEPPRQGCSGKTVLMSYVQTKPQIG